MELNQDVVKKEIEKLKKKVKEFKGSAEANVVGCIYKNTELLYTTDLEVSDFSNGIWALYFAIAKEIVLKEKKEVLDDLTIGLFLEKHSKMKIKYEQNKGYSTIEDLRSMVNEKNFDGYTTELNKWKTVLTLLERGFLVDLKEAIDSTLDELYDYYEALINDSFVKGATDDIVGSFDISEGLDDLILELDAGMNVGLPYKNMPLLSKEINGVSLGSVTLLGGTSGSGKSSAVRSTILTSIIEHGEKCLVILNEEDEKKWQSETLVWVANNILKKEITKYTVRDGKFSDEDKGILLSSAKWLKEYKEQIVIVPFRRWKVMTAIKLIRKYQRAFGVKYAIVDTFKLENDANLNNTWLVLAQNMVSMYDAVKKNNKNEGVGLICTFQLSKDSVIKRYYTQNSIGVAKSIIDVASVCIMNRWLLQDEYPEGKHELKVFEVKGKNGSTKIPVNLDKNKKYQVFFIVKNRFGATDSYQIVVEVDLSRNIYKEIGITSVMQDF